MEQITKDISIDKEPVKVMKNKHLKKSSSRAYKITFFALVGSLFLQSVSTSITHYQINLGLESIKRDQANKIATIQAATTQFHGVTSKLAQLADEGNQNAVEVISQFKNAGIDIRLGKQG